MPHPVIHVIDNTTSKPRPLNVKVTSGALSVDGSATTQPVSGTFYQATHKQTRTKHS